LGGNMGVHFPKHDPPSELDPKSWKKIFGIFSVKWNSTNL
jgi:hypothetical protein